MHSILQEIYQTKQKEIAQIPADINPKRELPQLYFRDYLPKERISLIAEIKKASPSRGLLRADFNLEKIIEAYKTIPVSAVSVLTDEKYFQGSSIYLQQVKRAIDKPVLRKDFILDEKQIIEAYNWGADIILLIVAMLSYDHLTNLIAFCDQLKLDTLVEVHDNFELEQALNAGATIVGVNNRDLNTFHVDLNTSLELVKEIPASCIKIAESGIHNSDDITKIEQAGFDAVLIGEAFMAHSDIFATYNRLFLND